MNTEHQTSCDPAANTNNRKHQSAGDVDLNRRLYELAGENARSVSAGNLLLPNEALTPKNLHDLFSEIGWEPLLSEDQVVISANFASGLRDDDLTAMIVRNPSGLRILMDWYIRPEKSLAEKLLFVNQMNVAFAGFSMAYMGVPTGPGALATPQPGVVGTCCYLVADKGLTINQITTGAQSLIDCTLTVAALAHSHGLLDEQRWPLARVEAVTDLVAQCEAILSEATGGVKP
jgi:hypothetical protein